MKVLTVSYKSKNNSREFTQSLHQTGFSVLKDHPIDFQLINSVYSEWEVFFNNQKKYDFIFDTNKQDGYFPLGTENAKGASLSDLKEFYHFYLWGKIPNNLSDNTKELYEQLVALTSTLLSWIQDETPNNIKSSFSKIYTITIVLFLLFNFNNVWANNFISRGYYVIDLSQKLEWMTCTVGMVWDKDKCVGNPIKVKLDQIDSVISQANEQLEGSWRLPNRE